MALSFVRNLCGAAKSLFTGPEVTVLSRGLSTTGVDLRRYHPHQKKKGQFPLDKFHNKKIQEWYEWDGFGPYKARPHIYPTNITLRDVQRRRILKAHAEERNRVVCLFRNDILPKELQELARVQIHDVPRDSGILRVNRRCAVTGRARGIWHQFRVSRFVVRAQADYNKLSGVKRAKWMYSTHLEP